MELNNTEGGYYDYCGKQLSGIYDEINEPDDNTYTGLQQEDAKANEPESSYTKLTDDCGALTTNIRVSDDARGAAAATEYLQLVNDEYVEVLPDDKSP